MIQNKLCYILFFLLPFIATAQFNDAGMWTSFSCSVDLNKKWQVAASPEVRLNENLSRLSRAFVDLGAQYKYNKHLFLSLTYRGGTAQLQDYFESRQRLQFGVAYKDKIHDFSFSIQSRWQAAVRAFSPESDADFITTIRNKAQVKYTGLKGIDLATSFELFNNTKHYQQFVLQNWRWVASAEKKINKTNSISLGYLIQKDLLSSPQKIEYVVLLAYQISLERKKEEKEIVPVAP